MNNILTYRFFVTHPKIVILEWNHEPDNALLHKLIKFQKAILKEIKEVIQITQGFCSLMLYHDSPLQNIKDYKSRLCLIYNSIPSSPNKKGKHWQIPVCYEETYAPDLKLLATQIDMNPETLVEKHVSTSYKVCFIGFLPGFLYLSGLPKVLEFRRKEQPVTNVPYGSIGIGGRQTGIYTLDSPGGWYIIGKTPYSFFDPHNRKPCFAQAGDSLVFKSISIAEYLNLEAKHKKGTLKIKSL